MAKRFHVSRTIAAPAERVWALLTDASTYRDWNPSIVSLRGAIIPGGTVEVVSTVDPKRTFTLKVTEMTPPTRMVWSSGMPLGLFTGERTYALVQRDGGTEFSMTEEFRGLLAGLVSRGVPDLTESFSQFADGLKAAAE